MVFKRAKFLFPLLCALLLFAGCAQKVSADDIAGKTYIYEKPGFGGNFTVTLDADGSSTYYEGLLSSYIGFGDWELDGDTLTVHDSWNGDVFNFRVEGGDLVFMAEGSSRFMFIDVSDGEKFSPDDETAN